MKILRNLLNFRSVTIVDNDVKVRGHCHITGKYRVSLKLNHQILLLFHTIKKYDCHVIMQELGKFNVKINTKPYGLEKYMSYTINNKLRFIDSFQFLSSSLDSFVKNLSKDNLSI